MSEQDETFATTRFGDLAMPEERRVRFPKGLLGFEDHHEFGMLEDPGCAPFSWLQSLEDPGLAFIVVNPVAFFAHYRVEVDRRELTEIHASDPEDFEVYVIVTVPEQLERMSANLQGPILINRKSRMGKQVVLLRSPYTTRHYLLDELHKRDRALDKEKARAASAAAV